MAAERMKKVAGLLNCPVCYEVYKRLPCYHSYCEGCMEKLQSGSNIICPECREMSVVPAGGVKELPNNFFINRLLDEVDLKRKVEGEDEAKCDIRPVARGGSGGSEEPPSWKKGPQFQ